MRNVVAALIVSAGLFAVAGALLLRGERPAEAQPKPAKWEYKVVALEQHDGFSEERGKPETPKMTTHFNALGADGWEYAGQVFVWYSVFKRPK